jgi:hypothetical protein
LTALAFLHGYGARVLLLWSLVLGVWGTIQYFRNRRIGGGFQASFLMLAGLIGVLTLAFGMQPRTLLHVVYGIFAVVFLPGAYLYSRSGAQRRESVVLAGACWIVSIAFYRGIATG